MIYAKCAHTYSKYLHTNVIDFHSNLT